VTVVMENGSGSRLQLFLKSLLPSLFSNVFLFSLFKTFRPPLFLLLSCLLPSFLKKFSLPESVVGFSPSPKFLPPFLPFSSPSIYKQEERELPPALSHRGAGGAGLHYLCRVRWSPVCRHGASVSSIIVAGYRLCHGALCHGLAKLGEREGEGEL